MSLCWSPALCQEGRGSNLSELIPQGRQLGEVLMLLQTFRSPAPSLTAPQYASCSPLRSLKVQHCEAAASAKCFGRSVSSSWPGKWKIGAAKTYHVVQFRAWNGIQGKTLQGQDVGGCGLQPSGGFISPHGGRKEEIGTIKALVVTGLGERRLHY